MIQICLLFILLVPNILVQCNPIFAHIPAQGLQITPSSQQLFPVLVQSPAVTSNVCPCDQKKSLPITKQTKIPLQNNPLANIILNKLFSSPSFQTIIENNSSVKPQNCAQVKTQTCCETPNIVNNYIIIPPEYFNLNALVQSHDTSKIYNKSRSTKKKNNHARKEINKENKCDETVGSSITMKNNSSIISSINNDFLAINQTETWVKISDIENKNKNLVEVNKQEPTSEKKIKTLPEISVIDDNEIIPKRSQLDERSLNNSTTFEIKELKALKNFTTTNKSQKTNATISVNKFNHKPNSTNYQAKSRKNSGENKTQNNKRSNRNRSSRQRQDQRRQTSNRNSRGRINNQKRLNTNDEIVVNDLHNKYPQIPKELIRNIFGQVKQQVLQSHSYYNPSSQYSYPQIFENFYKPFYDILKVNKKQQNIKNNNQSRKKNNSNKPRNSVRKRIESRKLSPSVELIPKKVEIENITINANSQTDNNTKTSQAEAEITTDKKRIESRKPSPSIELTPKKVEIENVTINADSQTDNNTKTCQAEAEITTDRKMIESRKPSPSVELTPMKVEIENVTINANSQTDNNTKKSQAETEITTEPIKIDHKSDIGNNEPHIPMLQVFNNDKEQLVASELPEDYVSLVDDIGIISDYFPNFRTDNKIYEEHSPFEGLETEELSRERRKFEESLNNNELTFTSHSENIATDTRPDNEFKSLVDSNVEEIIFRPPPSLENPDFETRPVYLSDNGEHSEASLVYFDTHDEYNDVYMEPDAKISSYSDVKNPQFTKVKPLTEVKRVKVSKRPMNVETFYAKSKIVKYGQSEIANDQKNKGVLSSDLESEYIEKEKQLFSPNRGDTTIVVAKSIGNPEDYWIGLL